MILENPFGGGVVLDVDVERTRELYASIEAGDAGGCGCTTCANFAAQRERAYPPEAIVFFERLGIDWHKEEETPYYGPARIAGCAERGLYIGAFPFSGRVEGDSRSRTVTNGNLFHGRTAFGATASLT